MLTKNTILEAARDEGWNESTCILILSGALDALIAKGQITQNEVDTLINARRAPLYEPPCVHDDIEMQGSECLIEVAEVPEDQPRANEGVYAVIDQYGETHQVESNGELWVVLTS